MSDALQGKGADDRHMPWPSPSTPCGALTYIKGSTAMYFRKTRTSISTESPSPRETTTERKKTEAT